MITRSLPILLLFFVLPSTNHAQILELEGLWEGTITISGEDGAKSYPMQLYLDKRGKQVTGRAYIYLTHEKVLETQLKGRLYDDLSIYIDETEFVPNAQYPEEPPFLRKFQFLWRRSFSGSSLNGYWQQITDEVFGERRQRGRVFLKKVTNEKA